MEGQEVLISEAKLSSGILLASVPVILAAIIAVAGLSGKGLEEGIYYGAFGPVIYLIFFGGLAYAFYEFTKIIKGRSRYLTYQDGYLHILEQKSLKLDHIRSITIERKFLWKSLVIKASGGATTRIRGYLLKRDLEEVKGSISALQQSDDN